MAKEVSTQKSGTVYVGCRLPHGLLLQLTKAYEQKENVLGGGVRTFTIHRRVGEKIKLNGIALGKGERPRFTLANGAAITKVPADFWAQWLEQNADSDVVKNQLVFAQSSEDSTRANARELKKEKTGFEPINPSVDSKGRAIDPRMKGVKPVKKNDEDEDEDNLEEA